LKIRVAVLVAVIGLSACQVGVEPAPGASPMPISKPPATLTQAIARADDLGPADSSTVVSLDFGLKAANPDAALVERAVATLESAGMRASWRSPSSLIAADGPAPVVAGLLGVRIDTYRSAGGSTFYATLDRPTLPATVAAVASDVSGLDNYRRARSYAIRAGGLTPADVLTYYNLKPLRDAGFDGTGETILFPEIDDLPNLNDLEKFATEFSLPPFAPILTVKRNSAWGTPMKPEGEAVLDLEIAHAIAPAAKLVV